MVLSASVSPGAARGRLFVYLAVFSGKTEKDRAAGGIPT